MDKVRSLGALVGENLARLREAKKLTQHELSHAMRRRGLRWTRSKIGALEAGHRSSFDLGDLIVLAWIIDVPAVELLRGDGLVTLNDADGAVSCQAVRMLLTGDAWQSATPVADHDISTVLAEMFHTAHHQPTSVADEADRDLAKRLAVPLQVITAAAHALWGHTLTDERDRRTRSIETTMTMTERHAHRGHITRELAADITAHLGTTAATTNPTPSPEERTPQ